MSKKAVLKQRAHMFAAVRDFFRARGVLEVDTPILSKSAPIDTYIEVMEVHLSQNTKGFLHTSPEYAMKRLIALGCGDIYQMSHVFREGEWGRLHNPEFMMVEWYRIGMSFDDLIQETLDFIQLFLNTQKTQVFTYRRALLEHAGIDYLKASHAQIIDCIKAHDVPLPDTIHTWNKDTLLNFVMGFIVEPKFEQLTVLRDYPASQSALAKTEIKEGESVALRFEIYFKGVELANGFYELVDASEQRERLNQRNKERISEKKAPLPLDENFLNALALGMPECSGVAVGFDRLLMLQLEKKSLKEILPFAWDEV